MQTLKSLPSAIHSGRPTQTVFCIFWYNYEQLNFWRRNYEKYERYDRGGLEEETHPEAVSGLARERYRSAFYRQVRGYARRRDVSLRRLRRRAFLLLGQVRKRHWLAVFL